MHILRQLLLLALLTQIAMQACPSHQFTANGTCFECDPNCDACAFTATNCIHCQDKSYLQNGTCTQCDVTCVTCTSPLVCTNCSSGHYMLNGRCAACGAHCANCNQTTCSACFAGYDIKTNCSTCTSSYYWNSTYSICNSCEAGCQACTASNHCSSCSQNYKYKNGVCFYQGSPPSSMDSSQMGIFIILGAVIGGILGIIVLVYIVYRCFFFKPMGRKQKDAQNSISNNIMLQSQSLSEHIPEKNTCLICNSGNADLSLDCGHNFHRECMDQSTELCAICHVAKPEKEVYLDQIANEPEINSQMTSEKPGKEEYMQYESQMKEESVGMEMEIVHMDEE